MEKMEKIKKQKEQKNQNKNGIKNQIQSQIGSAIIVVMAIITVLVVVVVYNLLIRANNSELEQDSHSVALQVEKYFAPFERMTEQLAIDDEVENLLETTTKGQKMTENSGYSAVLDKMDGRSCRS